MAELTISADEIRSAIQSYVTEYSPDVSREEVGTVTECGDGIARVEGLPSVMTNELLVKHNSGWYQVVFSPLPFVGLVAFTAFELLVALLQAYIFTILTAVYINESVHPEH